MIKARNLKKCFKINYTANNLQAFIKTSKHYLEIVMSSLSYYMAVLCLQSLIIRDLSSIRCTEALADFSSKYQETKEKHQISAVTLIK